MNKPQKYSALKLTLSQVANYLSNIISTLLNREICIKVKSEDDNYWSGAAVDNCFDIVELMDLIKAVNGDDDMIYQSIPDDSNKTRFLSMCLSEALLKRALKLDWETAFVTEDTLWIIEKPIIKEVQL